MNRISPLKLDPLAAVTQAELAKRYGITMINVMPSTSGHPSSSSSISESDDGILDPGCGCCCCAPGTTFSTFCPDNLMDTCRLSSTSHTEISSITGTKTPSSSGRSLSSNSVSSSEDSCTSSKNELVIGRLKSPIFLSTRFLIAVLLCFCFISLSISTSNISVSMVCMIRKPLSEPMPFAKAEEMMSVEMEDSELKDNKRLRRQVNHTNEVENIREMLEKIGIVENATVLNYTIEQNSQAKAAALVSECQLARFKKHAFENRKRSVEQNKDLKQQEYDKIQEQKLRELTVVVESCYEAEKFRWSSTDQGMVFAAQNAGSLLMLVSGTQADRLNSKWTIVVALLLLVISNVVLPLVAPINVWLVIVARVLTGLSDALLQPSASSMITRWFPPKERPFAIGLITGGRQIGTLLILPVAGFLCSRQDILNGWPAIFYLSALIGTVILVAWLFLSADKPSKHFCTSMTEKRFVEQKIAEEHMGKRKERKNVPWAQILRCGPLYAGVGALICHEYPLVIMLQLLPKYINDVLKFSSVTNGIVSALPIAVLFISKTLSSSLSSLIGSRKKGRFLIARTPLVKLFNAIASLGLGICIGIVPLLTSKDQKVMAIVVLCFANAFAGLHTPGVQTALLQMAPAYTGIITGIAFGFVAIFGIFNKILSNFIVQSGTSAEWSIVFWISAFIAILPVGFFTIWGSADRQPWATTKTTNTSKHNNC